MTKLFNISTKMPMNSGMGENSFKRDTNQQTILATCSSVWENAGTSVPKWESGKSNQSCRSRGGGETEGKALIIESTLNQFNVTFYSESKSSIWRVGSALCLQPNQLLLTRARFLLWNVVKIFLQKKKTQHFDSSRKLVCQMSRLLNGEGRMVAMLFGLLNWTLMCLVPGKKCQ